MNAIARLRHRAASARAKFGHPGEGVVLFWYGRSYGWKDCLRDPEHERPGAMAVDADGKVYRAEGGDDYDGAKRWVEVAA